MDGLEASWRFAGTVKTESRIANPGLADDRLPGAALEAAFSEYYPRIVGALDRMLGDRAPAEEIAVDTFLKLAGQRLQPSAFSNLGGWLYRTATRLGIDWLRATQTRRRYERMTSLDRPPGDNPLDAVLRAETVRAVRGTLARIKPFHAQLLVLRSHGLSYKELAAALDIRPASVGKFLARAQSAFENAYREVEPRRDV